MKWKTNGIQFRRGCHECLIAQFNGCGCWWGLGAMATQQTMKSEFKRLGDYLGATLCEVKELYDENDNETEQDVIYYRFNYLGQLLAADDETQKYIPYHK